MGRSVHVAEGRARVRLHVLLPAAQQREGRYVRARPRADHAQTGTRHARSARRPRPVPAIDPRGTKSHSHRHRRLAVVPGEPSPDDPPERPGHRLAGTDSWNRSNRCRADRQADDEGPSPDRRREPDQDRVRHRSHAPRVDGQQAVLPRPHERGERRQLELLSGGSARPPGIRQPDRARSAASRRRRLRHAQGTDRGHADAGREHRRHRRRQQQRPRRRDAANLRRPDVLLSSRVLLDEPEAGRRVPRAEGEGQTAGGRRARATGLQGRDGSGAHRGTPRGRRARSRGHARGQRRHRQAGARPARRAVPHQRRHQRRRQADAVGRG